ncbi:DUF7448 domain-containing protein [Enterococcus durans]|uniref:DUF7448 domain-containing protein n=1 Tax=Enterococcus durans TaxID=53345 RepID=UPI00115D229B|nr:hypothetical protein [Enterococcus durans]MBE8849080.1 hypothetical protein [Enterococcus durans]
MWKDYVSLKELKKDLIFKKIVEWSESELILEDGTKLEVVCSEYDCCAWAEGEFKNVKLDAVITDIKIFDKVNRLYNGDGCTSYAEVVVYHNRNEIAKAECTANDGNGGYYYSVCALKVKDKLCVVTDA